MLVRLNWQGKVKCTPSSTVKFLQGVNSMFQICSIILAGGEGKRMKSDKPKALTEVLSKPMLQWIIDALQRASINDICVVTGSRHEYIEEYLKEKAYSFDTVFQAERLGTGHAVMMAKDFLRKIDGDVLILGADSPFIDAETILSSYKMHRQDGNSVTVISAVIDDPTGYGRIVKNENGLERIVEQKNATEQEKLIKEINSGAYWFNAKDLLAILDEITINSVTGEYYLTDAIGLLIEKGKRAGAFVSHDPDVILGANSPEQLQQLNAIAAAKFEK